MAENVGGKVAWVISQEGQELSIVFEDGRVVMFHDVFDVEGRVALFVFAFEVIEILLF